VTPTDPRPVRLSQLVVEVPDPAATADFLERGLELLPVPSGSGSIAVLTTGGYGLPTPQRILTLVPGPAARLREVVLELPDDADALRRQARAAGAEVEDVEGDEIAGPGFATTSGGVRISVRITAPLEHAPLAPSALRPRRLGHVNLVSADPSAVVSLMAEGFGLRLSEQVGDQIFFLRIGSEHHNIGVRAGTTAGAHHIALEVHGWDSYRGLCDRLAGLGWLVEFGPGRHGPGNNFFVYVRDPSSGLRFELFSDMAHIEDEATYVPHRWELHERSTTVNRWGPGPPQSFLE
jgi:catechol 2,3-dioxygenase-like lactoylglutathione lyase family enzyme